jgi:hypothetical protein
VWPSEENLPQKKKKKLAVELFSWNKSWQVYIIFSITLLPWQLHY